jgi:putative transposase
LNKDKEELLAFYDFPAEHWGHIRTTSPIESTFATVRHRTYKSKNCFSRITILTMVFKLCESAQDRWIKLRGFNYLGVKFIDGVRENGEKKSLGIVLTPFLSVEIIREHNKVYPHRKI